MEEALRDIPLYREFALLGSGVPRLPDASTIPRLRRLFEAHELSGRMLATLHEILQSKGLMLKVGSAVDTSLCKGRQLVLRQMAHIGADAELGLVHAVKCTPANVRDITVAHALPNKGAVRTRELTSYWIGRRQQHS